MILTICNFFYYLFTLEPSHFSDISSVGASFSNLWKSLCELFFNFGGGSSSLSVEFSPDLFEVASIVLSFVLVLVVAIFVLRSIWRLFTFR